MLNQEGFLSPEIEKIEKDFEKEFSFYIEKVRSYNIFFQESAFKFVIKQGSLQHWCLAALYLRSLSLYQSIFILSKKGITREANVLLRSLFEIKYIVIALSKFPDLVSVYLGQEAIEMKKILKNSRRWEKNFAEIISVKEVEYKLREVDTLININKIKKYSIKDFAERANQLMDYEMYYSILCLTGHSNIYDIKKHFILDKQGILASFNWGPNKNDITNTLGIATETMFIILDPLRDVFSLDIESEYHQKIMDYNEAKSKFKKQP